MSKMFLLCLVIVSIYTYFILQTPYRRGSVFPYLEHLEPCTCSAGWANLLASILNDAPRLQSLSRYVVLTFFY
ncbi:F-box/FBD/LRR-repeat protein At5g56570 [Brassica napus]|uniref:F-box/FBD/LRR-repeat protein At5g56570 n=1 Tax=Brassica napus TaxID=3708 RepID=UPI002079005F|nr:F-box/FBD/LRR-repeat protein At5g56570 [Brassica napus]